jgi:hypothetical protein
MVSFTGTSGTISGAVSDTISAAGNLQVTQGIGNTISVTGSLTFLNGTGMTSVVAGQSTIFGAAGLTMTLGASGPTPVRGQLKETKPWTVRRQQPAACLRRWRQRDVYRRVGNDTLVGGTGSAT